MHSKFKVTRTHLVILTLVGVLASGVAFEHTRNQEVPATAQPRNSSVRKSVRSEAAGSGSWRDQQAITQLKQEGTFNSFASALTTAAYSINRVKRVTSAHDQGTYEAFNTTQTLRVSFTGAGVRVQSSGEQNWQMGLRL